MSIREADTEDTTIYKVVVNHEEQYSIWPDWREVPAGWRSVEVSGPKSECLSYIETAWTDMRPLSLRQAMERAITEPMTNAAAEPSEPPEESLPIRLSRGSHVVELSLGHERTAEALARQIETGYVHVKFTETRGGTELGLRLEPDAKERLLTSVAQGAGSLRLTGGLTLDYTRVRCTADIDLATFRGTGHLELVGE